MGWDTKAVFEAICDGCGDELVYRIPALHEVDAVIIKAEALGWYIGGKTDCKWDCYCPTCLEKRQPTN